PGSECVVNVRFAPAADGSRDASLVITDDDGVTHAVALHGAGVAAPAPAQPAAPAAAQPAAPAAAQPAPQAQPSAPAAKKALLALGRGAHVSRDRKLVYLRMAVSLGTPAKLDVSAAGGSSRLMLQKNSRIGAFRNVRRAPTISARVGSAGTVTIELRLAKGAVRNGRLVRIVVHAH